MKEIVIDGIVYVPKENPKENPKESFWGIAVLERGFVYVGLITPTYDITGAQSGIEISQARSIIRWGTSRHLGELVNGPLASTKLGALCAIKVPLCSVVHTMDVEATQWKV